MRALVIDDNPLCTGSLANYFETHDFQVAGQASTEQDAVRLVHQVQTDVVLVNSAMLGTDGQELVDTIRGSQPACKIIFMTQSASARQIRRAARLGVDAFLVKDVDPDGLLRQVQRVMQGEHIFPEGLWAAPPSASANRAAAGHDQRTDHPLTRREIQVLHCLADGLTDRQISARLTVSEHTVKNHMKSIRHKLGVANRVQVSMRALELGLLGERHDAHAGR
jgi:DNA-binding NarL/FixJ family response regulator